MKSPEIRQRAVLATGLLLVAATATLLPDAGAKPVSAKGDQEKGPGVPTLTLTPRVFSTPDVTITARAILTATPTRTVTATPTFDVLATAQANRAALGTAVEQANQLRIANATNTALAAELIATPTKTATATASSTATSTRTPEPTISPAIGTATAEAQVNAALGQEMARGKLTATAVVAETATVQEAKTATVQSVAATADARTATAIAVKEITQRLRVEEQERANREFWENVAKGAFVLVALGLLIRYRDRVVHIARSGAALVRRGGVWVIHTGGPRTVAFIGRGASRTITEIRRFLRI